MRAGRGDRVGGWRRLALLAAAIVTASAGAGCFDAADQIRVRGTENLTGRWRVASYRSAEAVRAEGGIEFGADGVMRERLRFAGKDVEVRGGEGSRRWRDRAFEVEPGAQVGAFWLRLGDGQRLPLTFAPSGRLLIAWPAEVGRGWARLPAKVVLERVQGTGSGKALERAQGAQ